MVAHAEMTQRCLDLSSCDLWSRAWLWKIENADTSTRPCQLGTFSSADLEQAIHNLIAKINSHIATAFCLPFNRGGAPTPKASCDELIAIGKDDRECCVLLKSTLQGLSKNPFAQDMLDANDSAHPVWARPSISAHANTE